MISRLPFAIKSGPNTLWLAAMLLLTVAGCQSAYYAAMEQIGVEKRDLLVDRVEDARDAQDDAREQFADALEQFRASVAVDGGDLAETYDDLNRDYQRSQSRATAVTTRIDEVERVSEDLFEEWREELDEYSSAERRRTSEQLLRETHGRYTQMLAAMRRAESKMDPVLETMQDQVLFLKHNLNAQAIGSLRGELGTIERETAAVIAEMDRAITEADAFIRSMK